MTTFIIGSKANSVFPDIKPTNVIGINGSIFEIEKKFKDSSKLTMILAPHIFIKDFYKLSNIYKKHTGLDVGYLKNIRDNLMKKKVQEIIIRPLSDFTNINKINQVLMKEYEIKKLCTQYEIFSNSNYEDFILNSFKYQNINFIYKIYDLFFNKKLTIYNTLLSVFLKRTHASNHFKVSTGILGLMVAINNPKFKPPYYVIGIGNESSTYPGLPDKIIDRKNHLNADLNYIQIISQIPSLAQKVIFTDKSLSEYYQKIVTTTHKPKIKVVSISSLFQFYIFLSCIGEKDNKFNYAVILNNILLSDQTVSYIINLCKEKKFLFIDLRFFLKNNSENLVGIKSIRTYSKIINEFLKNYDIEDVFLRYKINLPESLLVNYFNKAKLNFFEDGLGDYIIKKNLLGFKKKAENSLNLKQKLIDIVSRVYPNNTFTKYHYMKNIYSRSNILYEFINYNNGDQKKNIINYSKKTVNIAGNFQKIINKESQKHFKLITKKSIVFLSHPFQHSTFEGTNNILHEIELYKKFLNILKKDYTDFQFFFKPHPNITPNIFDLLYKELKGFFIFLPKDILSEILISNKNVYGVGSFMSSSLFYSKILYKEKFVFYLDVTNQGVIEFDANLKTVIPIFEIFNIKRIKLNSKTN